MALKQLSGSFRETDSTKCPRCGSAAIIIDGRFVRWLTCPSCKFKKLIKMEDKATQVRVKEV
jgi:DNA-directed RNA polymerase subunit RPC12/RpoP